MRIEDHRLSFLTAHLVVSIFKFYEHKTASFISDHGSMDTVSVYYVGERVSILKIPAFCVFQSQVASSQPSICFCESSVASSFQEGNVLQSNLKIAQKFITFQKEMLHLKKHLAKAIATCKSCVKSPLRSNPIKWKSWEIDTRLKKCAQPSKSVISPGFGDFCWASTLGTRAVSLVDTLPVDPFFTCHHPFGDKDV